MPGPILELLHMLSFYSNNSRLGIYQPYSFFFFLVDKAVEAEKLNAASKLGNGNSLISDPNLSYSS